MSASARAHHHHAAPGTGGHVHGFGGSSLRALLLALILNAAYTAIEAIAGVLTDSLALLSDAGHNLSDVLALGVAAGAVWLARRPTTPRTSFGLKRAEILAALVNAVSLIAIAIVVLVAACRRLSDPPDVPGGWLIAVAAVGLAINALGAALVFRRGGRDLNLRASFLHLAGDALGSLGVIVAGLVIVTTGWVYADPVFSIVLAILILASSWLVLRDAVLVLLEAAPRDLDAMEIGEAMAAEAGVVEVHDLHVWTITSDFPALSAHVLVRPGDDCHAVRRSLEGLLHERFGIDHTTLQVEHRDPDRLLTISRAR